MHPKIIEVLAADTAKQLQKSLVEDHPDIIHDAIVAAMHANCIDHQADDASDAAMEIASRVLMTI